MVHSSYFHAPNIGRAVTVAWPGIERIGIGRPFEPLRQWCPEALGPKFPGVGDGGSVTGFLQATADLACLGGLRASYSRRLPKTVSENLRASAF